MKNLLLIVISLALLSFLFLRDDKEVLRTETSLNKSNIQRAKKINPNTSSMGSKTQFNKVQKPNGPRIVKLSDIKLTDCLIYSNTCQEINEFKRSVSSNGYYNPSLTPYHHDFQERLEENGESIQTELLFKALDINNSGIYLLVIEELYRRDLTDEQKKVLLDHINKNSGDVLASSLVTAYRLGKIKRELILDGFLNGIAKSYSSALALAKRVFHLKPSFEELQVMVDKSCEYKDETDEELFRTLISSYRRQARSLNIAGIYYCNKF